MPDPDFFSPAEFASHSGLSLATVRRYLKSGRLPSAQVGGRRHRVLIPRGAIDRLLPTLSPAPPATGRGAEPLARPNPGPRPRWLSGGIH